MHLFAGDLTAATSLTNEAQAAMAATGSNLAPYGALGVAAFRGDEAAAVTLLETTMEDITRRDEGVGITFAEWANAALNNGLGRYDDALTAAQRATSYLEDAGSWIWPMVELIEAAARNGVTDTATDAYDRLAEMTSASRTDWALGLQARSRALLSDGEAAERLYRESLTLLGRTRLRVTWLALTCCTANGCAGNAAAATHAINCAPPTVCSKQSAWKHSPNAPTKSCARPARPPASAPRSDNKTSLRRKPRSPVSPATDFRTRKSALGCSSAHTVQYHLRKIFAKLGITSCSQLDRVLPNDPSADRPTH